jgi:hypothetical protein
MSKFYSPNIYFNKNHKSVFNSFSLLWLLTIFIVSPTAFSQQKKVEAVITPSTVIDVVYVQPFSLKTGYTHFWREEKPFVKSGTLAVFKVNPNLVYPRNALEPVLYVGNQTAERLNFGHESGYVVAIIPSEVDLSKSRAWFGTPELPERVNEKTINIETDLAEKGNIQQLDPDAVNKVTQQYLDVSDLATLLRDHAAELVLKYSPQEKALAEAWRLPVAKR